MSSDILREMVSVIGRLRRETTDPNRVEEWAARLEEHLAELECLATQAVPDAVEPTFEAAPLGPYKSAVAAAGVVGTGAGLAGGTVDPADVTAQGRSARGAGTQTGGTAKASLAGITKGLPTTLLAAHRLLRTRCLSPVELVEQHLERIRQAEELKAFIAVFEAQARHEQMCACGCNSGSS